MNPHQLNRGTSYILKRAGLFSALGTTLGHLGNANTVNGVASGSNMFDHAVNGLGATSAIVDSTSTALNTIKPLGQVVAKAAPSLASGIGTFAAKWAPPVAVGSLAYQTGKAIASPIETANNTIQSNADSPWYKNIWDSIGNPPAAVAGAFKAVGDTAGTAWDLGNQIWRSNSFNNEWNAAHPNNQR